MVRMQRCFGPEGDSLHFCSNTFIHVCRFAKDRFSLAGWDSGRAAFRFLSNPGVSQALRCEIIGLIAIRVDGTEPYPP